jgi:hypothetical protein
MKIVDPELNTDWTTCWNPPDVQQHQFAIRAGGELTVCRFPE